MAYCYEHAIPHSRFLGGADVWLDTDRLKTMAFALEKAERCPACGTAPWEWEENRGAYVAVKERCQGCMRREAAMEDSPPGKGERVSLYTEAHAQDLQENPEVHQLDSPRLRRERKAARKAEAT